jgi:hypothetical protein
MSGAAIAVMVIAMVLIWGGLAASLAWAARTGRVNRRAAGQEPDGPEDASGTARVSWHDDALYVLVEVTDDVLGAVVTPDDAKRHWRTDSIEITIDPRGDSRDTSTTFKAGLFPLTDDPQAGNTQGKKDVLRSADFNNGSMQAGDKAYAATARPAVARIPRTVYDALGDTVTLTGDRGTVTLPAEPADDMVDGVVWVPANSFGNGVLTDLASPGSRVTITGGDS